jgi:hypothetical protein
MPNSARVVRFAAAGSKENREMASRTRVITKTHTAEEIAHESFGQQKRPEMAQFRLQVDRQTKGSYETYKDAEEAGLAIKHKYPIVQVSVYDAIAGTNKIVEIAVPS